MDAQFTVSVGAVLGILGFLLQVGVTIGAIAFSHGALNQRVRALEEKGKAHDDLERSVTRLETEMEAVGREIKLLRNDLKYARSELRLEMRDRVQSPPRRVRPFDVPDARDWLDEEQ